jgi:hypothetical protein
MGNSPFDSSREGSVDTEACRVGEEEGKREGEGSTDSSDDGYWNDVVFADKRQIDES